MLKIGDILVPKFILYSKIKCIKLFGVHPTKVYATIYFKDNRESIAVYNLDTLHREFKLSIKSILINL